MAIDCEGAEIGSNVFCQEWNGVDFLAKGGCGFSCIRVQGQFSTVGGCFFNPNGIALDLFDSSIGQTLALTSLKRPNSLGLGRPIDGGLNLRQAKAQNLLVDRTGLPIRGKLQLVGFTFDTVGGEIFDLYYAPALDWLSRQHGIRRWVFVETQPWIQLAKVFQSAGRARDSRALLMDMNGRRTLGSVVTALFTFSWPLDKRLNSLISWLRRGNLPNLVASTFTMLLSIFTHPRNTLRVVTRAISQLVSYILQNVFNLVFLLGTYLLFLVQNKVLDVGWLSALLQSVVVMFGVTVTTRFLSGFVRWLGNIASALASIPTLFFSGILVGWGFRPFLAIYWSLGFILIGTFVFEAANSAGYMRPTEEEALLRPEYVESCILHDEYEQFNSFIYSLDSFIPFVDLHQQTYYRPRTEGEECKSSDGSTVIRFNPTSLTGLTYGDLLPKPIEQLLPRSVSETKMPQSVVAWIEAQLGHGGAKKYLWIHIILGYFFATLAVTAFTGLIKQKE